MREEVIKAAEQIATDGQIACADVHEVATRLGVSPLEVGRAVSRATDLRFYRCQLGLFGYGPKPEGKHKIVLKAAHIPSEIEAAIDGRVRDGSISCSDAWEVADQFRYPRLGIANIIEAMGLKVTPCQLGSF